MNATTDEILFQRRLRSSELALEAARRRLAESEVELAALRAHLAELERGAPEPVVVLDPGLVDQLQAELEVQIKARREAEQALQAERDRGEALMRELARRTTPAIEGVERELEVAQRRARHLEAELELVRRHAAEFEHGIRLAVEEAWSWLGELGERANGAFHELDDLHALLAELQMRGPNHGWRPEPGQEAPDISPERLDHALARLRAGDPLVDPPATATDDPPARTGGRWSWLGR